MCSSDLRGKSLTATFLALPLGELSPQVTERARMLHRSEFMQQYLEAGKVVTTHGVRGEMKLELWCDGVDFLKKVSRLYPSAQGGKAYKILSIRPQGQMALLQLEGVSDMDAARALRGQVFYFDRNDATLPVGRWYVADLIGCEVRDADTGKVYGVVTSVDHPGAQRSEEHTSELQSR